MPRTVPVSATQVTGNLITGALWNAGPAASNTFLTTVPIARLHQTLSQSLVNNSYTLTAFDQTDLDPDGGHSNSVNNSRYTFQVAGTYWLAGGVSTSTNTSGFREVAFRVNGSTIWHKSQLAPSPSFEAVVTTGVLLPFAVNDYVELGSWQNSGSNLSTVVSDQSVWPWMDVFWVHS